MSERAGGSRRLPTSAWVFDSGLALVAAGLATATLASVVPAPVARAVPGGMLALGMGLCCCIPCPGGGRAVVEERLRLARELHDVVAHAMSVIAVQSGVGAHVAATQPKEAAKALAAIEGTSRAGSGHGLIGMAERVQAFGGDFQAGPCLGGGFRVAARLPLVVEGR